MIVLDYLKLMANDTLLIPPFHTGHLGLLPNTDVIVGLATVPGRPDNHCELLITPYQPSSSMAHVHCIMTDRPGVVQGLVEAISLLGINIVTQESSAIDSLNNHSIDLLIDWSRSAYAMSGPSNPSQRARYAEWRELFPIREARYVKLFESIMAHCGHRLVTGETGRVFVPRLAITPLHVQDAPPQYPATIERVVEHEFWVKMVVPPKIMEELRNRLNTQPGDSLYYVVLSETEDRTLRVFFPRPALVPLIVHMGFYHHDISGALLAITRLLANEDFNILTSLLRKISPELSVWEAMLEYRGKDLLPPPTELRQQIQWLAEKLTRRAKSDGISLARFGFKLGLPLYPPRKKGPSDRVALVGVEAISPDNSVLGQEAVEKQIRERLNEARGALGGQPSVMNQVLSAVSGGILDKHSVFISFPRTARRYADLLVTALEKSGDYRAVIYEAKGVERITDAVLERINECDYFIGVWHHDEDLRTKGGKYGISPWMFFEYGIASTLRKPRLVIHSDKLDERIWNRIEPGIANPEYNDLGFEMVTVQDVLQCLKSFS